MRHERCINVDCLRPYQVNEFDFGDPAGAGATEKYTCPHCGYARPGIGNSTVLVHALTSEQEEEFNRTHPLRQRRKAARGR